MATVKYLLSPSDFKAITAVHGNVDDDLIEQSILSCQELFIEQTIGSTLYDYLLDNIGSLTSNYVTLLEDYIHPAMKYWIMSDLVDVLSNRFTNMGVGNKAGENIIPLTDESKRRMANKHMNKATTYARRLFDYLYENEDTFTQFRDYETDWDDYTPTRRRYQMGIFTGGVRGRKFDGLDSFSDEEHHRR